jgi:hypothetical protein
MRQSPAFIVNISFAEEKDEEVEEERSLKNM